MARRLARWTLRGIRAALAVVALAALAVWATSFRDPMTVRVMSSPLRDGWYYRTYAFAGWDGGRLGIGWGKDGFSKTYARKFGLVPETDGPAWIWKGFKGTAEAPLLAAPSGPGLIGWSFQYSAQGAIPTVWRSVSFPCYLLALLAGAWPLASAAAFIRRRRRASLRLRLNLCRHCGYDLRATPSAGGATLATCPECGTPAAPA